MNKVNSTCMVIGYLDQQKNICRMKNSKKRTVNTDKQEHTAFDKKYYYLDLLEYNDAPDTLKKTAISVFDHWLDEVEANDFFTNMTDESSDKLSNQFKLFHEHLIDNHSCLTYKFSGRLTKRSVKFKHFTSRENGIKYLEPAPFWAGNQYRFSLIIDDLEGVYLEGSDYTNYFFSKDKNAVESITEAAKKFGLYALPL